MMGIAMTSKLRLDIAIKSIEFARNYTNSLLDDLTAEDWFQQPPGGVTHIAWQVGHIAMAQYALTMIRLRGKEPEDQSFITNDFFKTFKKGTTPNPDATVYPSVEEIRSVFDAVYDKAMSELPNYTDEELDVKLPEPHAVFDTKLGSIYFCSYHEMLHAGQIGLVRRLIGKKTIR